MRAIFSIFLVIMLLSCEDKVNYEKPEGLIGKAKMTSKSTDSTYQVQPLNASGAEGATVHSRCDILPIRKLNSEP